MGIKQRLTIIVIKDGLDKSLRRLQIKRWCSCDKGH